MNEILILGLSWLEGGLLGAIFFGGLWWTVRKSISSPTPVLWIFGSLIARMTVALIGFYYFAAGHWEKMLVCLLGFITARAVVTWLTRPSVKSQNPVGQEHVHAP